jgi:hypothetical protein
MTSFLGVVEDSPYRCPRCCKRLVVEVEPGDGDTSASMWHVCWHCDYAEQDRQWWVSRLIGRKEGS